MSQSKTQGVKRWLLILNVQKRTDILLPVAVTLNECGQKWRNIYQRYFDVNNLTTKTIKLSQPPYVKTIIV